MVWEIVNTRGPNCTLRVVVWLGAGSFGYLWPHHINNQWAEREESSVPHSLGEGVGGSNMGHKAQLSWLKLGARVSDIVSRAGSPYCELGQLCGHMEDNSPISTHCWHTCCLPPRMPQYGEGHIPDSICEGPQMWELPRNVTFGEFAWDRGHKGPDRLNKRWSNHLANYLLLWVSSFSFMQLSTQRTRAPVNCTREFSLCRYVSFSEQFPIPTARWRLGAGPPFPKAFLSTLWAPGS